MFLCPFCNQVMEKQEAGTGPGEDLYFCGACQNDEAISWLHGENVPSPSKDKD